MYNSQAQRDPYILTHLWIQQLLPMAQVVALHDPILYAEYSAAVFCELAESLMAWLQERWQAVVQILRTLVEDYAYSPQANCRKGGLLALAAAAVALADRKGVRHLPLAYSFCTFPECLSAACSKSRWLAIFCL